MITPDDVLLFWFGDDPAKPLKYAEKWWQKNAAFDAEVRKRFGDAIQAAFRGEMESWKQDPPSCLAYIILLDQFSRNCFRERPEAFAQDSRALAASLQGQERGFDRRLSPVERWFFYMPMEHAEDPEMQRRSVRAFRELASEVPPEQRDMFRGAADYADRHAEIIFRFGRFPHRNAILGRSSTAEELEFLRQPGSSF
jgi:Uncharacterized protein conserved in bacteria